MSHFYLENHLEVTHFEFQNCGQCMSSKDRLITHACWSVNNVTVKFSTVWVYEKFYNFKYALYSFYPSHCFATCRAAQVWFQPYASKFYIRSEDSKGIKTLPLKRYDNCTLWSFLNMTHLEFDKDCHSSKKTLWF